MLLCLIKLKILIMPFYQIYEFSFIFSCKSEHISNNYPRGSTMPSLYREKFSDYRDEIDEELYLEKRLENHDFRMKRHYDKEVG